MSTAFAIGVLALAARCGLAFVGWMFSGAAAWIEPDEPAAGPPALPRLYEEERHDE